MMASADRTLINRIMSNCGKSIEAYERKLISRNAPFDQYVAGDNDAISPAAKRGLKLFIGKAACDACHQGPTFTDQLFHNTGIMQTRDPAMLDQGRFTDLPRALNNTFNGAGAFSDDPAAGAAKLAGLAPIDEMRGQFRTKSLRHLTETAPFFHDGSAATLEDVVRFYNEGGGTMGFPGTKDELLVPLNLTGSEIADLVAFLETLTGEPVPVELTENTAAP
jgi:cytochrome c peroxidase